MLVDAGARPCGKRVHARDGRAAPAAGDYREPFRAGAWAREHVRTDCVEYLVPQDSTSYWLHLAVLGNPSLPSAGAPPRYYFYKEAVVRWITNTSYPVTIADLSVVPREIREDVDVLARFGHIIVGRRRGSTGCQR